MIGGQLCQVQGHEGQKLSHICIFIDCLNASRWLCSQCVRKQTHIHKDGINGLKNLRTTMEFMRDFEMKIQPLLDLKLNSLDGIQVKYHYLQKIYKDLDNFLNFVSPSQKQNLKQEQIVSNILLLEEAIVSLNNLYQNETLIIQTLKDTCDKLNNFGLRCLTNKEIIILLKINTEFFKEESIFYQRMIYFIRKLNNYLIKHAHELSEIVKQVIQDATYKLQKLKEYINYEEDQTFDIDDIDYDNIFLSQNERYFALLNKDQIQIRDLNSKKQYKTYHLTNHTQLISFDDQLRYLIIFDNHYNLCYYLLQGNNKSIKLIKKYYLGYYVIRRLILININKIMLIFQNQIEILNFRYRSANSINLYDYDSTDIELVFYGRIKRLIVITIKINDNQTIFIYKYNQKQPFIQQDVNIEQSIQINQISLASNDTLLLTEDQYEIKLWQIQFQDKGLILINRVKMNEYDDYWFSYSLSDYNIKLWGYDVQIQDKNFNVLYEITTYNIPNKILVSEQFVIIIFYSVMNKAKVDILRKARTDYLKLV